MTENTEEKPTKGPPTHRLLWSSKFQVNITLMQHIPGSTVRKHGFLDDMRLQTG